MFIKRVQPGARRAVRRSRSSDSNAEEAVPIPVKKVARRKVQRSSSDSEGNANEVGSKIGASMERRPNSQLSTSIDADDDDVAVFKVRKTKLSRQMDKQRAPVGTLSKGGLSSHSQSDDRGKRAWKGEDSGDGLNGNQENESPEKPLEKSPVLPNEADIVSITDDADQIVPGEDADSASEEPESQAGTAARIARARRAAAREVYGSGADAAGFLDHQPDYIPMVRPKQSKPMIRAAAEGRTDAGSPFEPNAEVPLRALVAANVVDASAETEEADDWAMQQMRVGTHRRHGSLLQPELVDQDGVFSGGFVKPSDRDAVPLPKSLNIKAKFAAGMEEKVAIPSLAMATLWETMQKLEASGGDRAKRDLELENQREQAVDQLSTVKGEVGALDKKLQVAQQLEEFAWGIGGFLDAKAPKVAQAAKTLGQMEQDFTAKSRRRRIRDLADDLVRFGGASLTIPLADDDAEAEPHIIASAAERRQARRKRRQHRAAVAAAAREGWDTSSMSEEDCQGELASDRGAFCNAVHKQILGDVSEGFSVAALVLEPIRVAKKQLGDEYVKAYVPNSLPDVLALYIDYSLLWWDPLAVCLPTDARSKDAEAKLETETKWGPLKPITSSQFEGFSWFEDLADFTELLGDDDPDTELVPKLMQRCLFPEVLRRIRDCWDVTSVRHTEQIVVLLDECLLFEVDETAIAYTGLLEATANSLNEGLTAYAPQVFVPNEALSKWYASAARMRLLWRSCKIARCALLFDQRLPEQQLSQMVLSSIFATRIAPHLRAPRLDAAELALIEEFVSLLPERWLQPGLPPTLVPLRDALGPRAPKGAEAAATAEAAARILARMGCHDEAQVIRAGL